MSDAGGPYLFDVGVIELAHTDAPIRDAALSYVRDAITGDIDAVVPYPAVFGAHTVLTTYYGRSNADASRLLQNFVDAKRIDWYGTMSEGVVRGGLSRAGDANVGGWDGYYAEVAIEEGVTKTLDYDEWVANVDPPVGRRERLDVVFADRPPGATEAFEAADSEAEVESFATPKLSLRATR